jgi:hypothetical protein
VRLGISGDQFHRKTNEQRQFDQNRGKENQARDRDASAIPDNGFIAFFSFDCGRVLQTAHFLLSRRSSSSERLDHVAVEFPDVIQTLARDKTIVDDYLLAHPFGAGVF